MDEGCFQNGGPGFGLREIELSLRHVTEHSTHSHCVAYYLPSTREANSEHNVNLSWLGLDAHILIQWKTGAALTRSHFGEVEFFGGYPHQTRPIVVD